jgi:hypothetical protein
MTALRATEIFNDAKQMLIAIESVGCRHIKTSKSYQLYGKIEPIAVIVCSSGEIYAFDMAARYILLDELRQNVPELDGIIASFNNA